MFRTRGRPDDPQNLKLAEQYRLLSDAIHVNPLLQTNPTGTDIAEKQRELQRRRLHFEQFRETYQQRLQKYQKKVCTSTGLIEPSSLNLRQVATDFPRKPFSSTGYSNKPQKEMKTVTLEIPLTTKQNAVWCPGQLPSTAVTKGGDTIRATTQHEKVMHKDTSEVLRKLKNLESNVKTKIGESNDSIQVATKKEIEEVNKQIDVAEMQLQHITSLIEEKKKLSMVTKSQTEIDTSASSKCSSRENTRAGTKKLTKTLNALNRRLQSIQDKFKSHTKYKAVKDYLTTKQSIVEIYRNENFMKSSTRAKKQKPVATNKEIDEILNMWVHQQNGELRKDIKPESKKEVTDFRRLAETKEDFEGKNEDFNCFSFFEKELENSVLKSQFLLKEFKTVMDGDSGKTINGKKKGVHFSVPCQATHHNTPPEHSDKGGVKKVLTNTLYEFI